MFERSLNEAERQAAQRLLIRMVRPGEGVEDTRQRAAMPGANPVAEATIRKLADARLVVTERDPATGRETVEVAHEALIRGWQRLRGWVDQNREFLRTRERIAAQARLWEDEGKPPDRLLPPATSRHRRGRQVGGRGGAGRPAATRARGAPDRGGHGRSCDRCRRGRIACLVATRRGPAQLIPSARQPVGS